MLTITESILIECSPEDAWDVYQDLELRATWDHNVQRINWLDASGPAVGAKLAGVSKAVGLTVEWQAEVVTHSPPHVQAVRSLSGPFDFVASVRFEPFAGATRFTWSSANDNPQGFLGKMALELAARRYRRELRGNLERFRELVRARFGRADQPAARTSADVSRS